MQFAQTARMLISLDAMGGDHAPDAVLDGAGRARQANPELRFLLHGDEAMLAAKLKPFPALSDYCQLRHAPEAVGMDDKPSQVLRNKQRQQTSMWRTLAAVADGEAQAAVSGGNTGALMAIARLTLNSLPGVSRPAIAGLWPSKDHMAVVLDLGATVAPPAEQLAQFAIMGRDCARILLDMPNPSVGLLNVGVEEIKGTESVREAAKILRGLGDAIAFHGFIEGNHLSANVVDVVVTDGFTGNVALKVAEGTARQIGNYLSQFIRASFWARIGYPFMLPALNALRRRVDPGAYNGGVFLGLRGIAVKSHGGSDGAAYASAIGMAAKCAKAGLAENIAHDLDELAPRLKPESQQPAKAP